MSRHGIQADPFRSSMTNPVVYRSWHINDTFLQRLPKTRIPCSPSFNTSTTSSFMPFQVHASPRPPSDKPPHSTSPSSLPSHLPSGTQTTLLRLAFLSSTHTTNSTPTRPLASPSVSTTPFALLHHVKPPSSRRAASPPTRACSPKRACQRPRMGAQEPTLSPVQHLRRRWRPAQVVERAPAQV